VVGRLSPLFLQAQPSSRQGPGLRGSPGPHNKHKLLTWVVCFTPTTV
jgi:hypothetical protein